MCKGIFGKGLTDEEAAAEKERDFGNVPDECCVVICDDCYQGVRPDQHPVEIRKYNADKN